MNIQPLQLARISNLLSSSITQTQLTATQQQLLDVQNQLSSGKRISQPSQDPGAASVAIQLQKTLDTRQAYMGNLSQAQSQLGQVDTTLSAVTQLVQQAQSVASANVGSTVTAAQRQAASAIVDSIYSQAVSLANTQFEGAYLFGGDKANAPPFVSTAGGVQFVGSTTVLQNTYDARTNLPFMVSGADVFGALSSRVQGTADITPNLTAQTRLTDLRGATAMGVHLGTVLLGNGTTTKLVDLSHADNAGDVVSAINAAGLGNIAAAITGQGLTLSTTGTDNITVQDVGGGTTAADLGILRATGAGAGTSLAGANVKPNLTVLTPLSALDAGAGIDLTHGLKITNGASSATVAFSGATTVGDLLNTINGSGVAVKAQINPAGTGIDILNPTQGTPLTVSENGGTTAADLGVQSYGPASPLTELNSGNGVHLATGGPDFTVTRSDGTSFPVTLAGSVTVQDVINKINTASGGVGVTAGFSNSTNGITLTDTAGGAGTLTIAPGNFSTAAADLGLTASPASGGTITGADVNPVTASGIFANLGKLRTALNTNDQAGITAAAQGLQADYDRVVRVRGQAGARVQEMQSRQSQLQDQNLATQTLLSQMTDTDFAATIAKFQTLQTSLQATLVTSAKVLQESLLNFLG
ncbi:MAG: hypothetical protein JWM97_2194 [Phycisphaerales bacterium]|nr:hypothetical protein [Phycisphaerales bacterium]